MKKGFTLIELLAVIVILAIIALIASPIIIGLIDDARKESFKNSAYGIIKAGEILYSKDLLNGTNEEITLTYNNGVESSTSGKKLEYNGTKPKTGRVVINDKGQVAIAIYNGTYCSEKGYEESEVTLSEIPEEECFICPSEIVDVRDGETYATAKIGTQCWMAEDLRYDCSREGYTNVGTAESWTGTSNCGNQGAGYTGLLYQWSVAMKGSTTEGAQGLCPAGWHIPKDSEWKILEGTVDSTYPVGDAIWGNTGWRGNDAGTKLKEEPFNGKLAGYRNTGGSLSSVGSSGDWWTSLPSGSNAWDRGLFSLYSDVYRSTDSQANGISVRCLFGQ